MPRPRGSPPKALRRGGRGGGAKGIIAAREVGLSVLLLEKRQEIGSPVRCAEGVANEKLAPFVEPEMDLGGGEQGPRSRLSRRGRFEGASLDLLLKFGDGLVVWISVGSSVTTSGASQKFLG